MIYVIYKDGSWMETESDLQASEYASSPDWLVSISPAQSSDFTQWFIERERDLLNVSKLHVASAGWSAGYHAAQQGVQPTPESGRELPVESNDSEGSAPANSG